MPETVILQNQPSAAPSRKLTMDAIAQLITSALAIAAVAGFDIPITPETIYAILGGGFALVVLVGKIVAYFTIERAESTFLPGELAELVEV